MKPFSTSFEQRPDVIKVVLQTSSLEFDSRSYLFLALPITYVVNDGFRFNLTDLVTLSIPSFGLHQRTVATTRLQLFQTQAVTKQ